MSGPSQPGGRQWSSRVAFLIATIGFAIGLGNIWRFPYLAGQNGGGAFILVYILAVLVVGLPLVIAELAIGREGGPDVPAAWRKVAEARKASPAWRFVGWIGVLASFAIGSFYCVIGGWTMAFAWDSLSGIAQGGAGLDYEALLADPLALTFWQTLYLLTNIVVVSFGLRFGVERAVTILMPMLLVLLLGLLGLAIMEGAFAEAAAFLFTSDLTRLTPQVAVQAVGQAFFSVGIGLAILVTYGGYLGPDAKLGRLAAIIVTADTLMALLAGLVIFPFAFAVGLPPGEGPTLVFVTMQAAFAQLPGGAWLSALFFCLLMIAALTSSVALFEMLAAIGEDRGIERRKMLVWSGALLWLLGLGTVASFNVAADFHPLDMIPLFAGATVFGVIDIVTSTIALPLGGFLMALLVGWFSPAESWSKAIGWEARPWILRVWLIAMRFVIPAVLLIVLVSGVSP